MKRAIITGVRRIGYEIARHLLEDGWSVGLVYKSSEDVYVKLKEAFDERVYAYRADLMHWHEAQRAVHGLAEAMGGVDAFLHLSSPYEPTPIESLKEEDIQAHFNPIAQAFVVMSREVYNCMLENHGLVKGRIVAFGDWATNTTPYRNYSAYFLAKGALHTAVKVLAKEFTPHVLVNAIALGPTLKPPHITDEKWQEYINKTPLKRAVSLKDVVALTHYLLQVESMTGEIINLDSGRHVAGECA
ncbi:MAG: SDR family oxidoreductase [Aquificaceae bacterium]|nr:SDR family oxidoreductase [Aquificaceae bacterium]